MTSQQASQIDRSLAIVLAAVLSIVLLAVRFEERDTIALVDRIAGCLVLQYAQHITCIASLTVAQVIPPPQERGLLGHRLGPDSLWLRPRLSRLLALYHYRR
ncbi:hypothetical protein [Nonomuraea sp. NPDC049129]|uniref:hypothetical protein n=1 Tax=Nonomuraea sp. NPDC049129 TaxID=3155272 RepID=UPI0033C93560